MDVLSLGGVSSSENRNLPGFPLWSFDDGLALGFCVLVESGNSAFLESVRLASADDSWSVLPEILEWSALCLWSSVSLSAYSEAIERSVRLDRSALSCLSESTL